MSHFRFVPLALALAATGTLMACTAAPAVPMGSAPAGSMATPESMAAMDGQMKTMRDMQTKMTNAKTPEERQALMGEHMKAMQGGMAHASHDDDATHGDDADDDGHDVAAHAAGPGQTVRKVP